jgi:hypothetical protein
MLLRLLRCDILAWPTSISPSMPPSSRPGSASARDSRFATSFLLGRRRFCVLADDFSIFDTNEECLIFCLSLLEAPKAEDRSSGLGSVAGAGRAARADFARAVVRFLMGAYGSRKCFSFQGILPLVTYHDYLSTATEESRREHRIVTAEITYRYRLAS